MTEDEERILWTAKNEHMKKKNMVFKKNTIKKKKMKINIIEKRKKMKKKKIIDRE